MKCKKEYSTDLSKHNTTAKLHLHVYTLYEFISTIDNINHDPSSN